MKFKSIHRGALLPTALAALIASTAVTGCSVKQTEEGELPDVDLKADAGELPEYEIVKKDDGRLPDVDVDVKGGNLPEFDVDWVDVDVALEEETVTVPKVKLVTEEETVKVPKIDIDMPGGDPNEKERRELEVKTKVPHPGYEIEITEIYAHNNELIVVSNVEKTANHADMDEDVEISDRVVLNAPDFDVKYYITGDRPKDIDDDYVYFSSRSEIADKLKAATKIYTRS